MYPSASPPPTFAPPAPPTGTHCAPAASANYAFLANPPKHKHKPQPLAVRCTPPRSLPRLNSSRRRASISGSPAFQTSFLALVDTPNPALDTPKTPGLTNHGYTAAFATYPRRGSLPDVQQAENRPVRRAPTSPKRAPAPRSVPSSPKRQSPSGSPKRRQHRVPTPGSPFAPPSPTRTRARADSTTRIPVPTPRTPSAPRTPKLSKIRSLTNLRARSPSPAPPSRTTSSKSAMTTPTTSKPTSKRAKRSATPARGSAAYAKYRPMPFIQQMQMVQFLEGGSLDSHIRRHHVHAGQGTARTGFATGAELDVAHGYAFMDESGMVWFDEEEEWEFACLLPRARPQRRRGIKRLLGKRKGDDEDDEDEWEEFVDEEDEEDVDPEVLLAREDDDLHAGDEDLAAFGGSLQGAWARDRPAQSVLNLPERKVERKRKRARRVVSSTPVPAPQPSPAPDQHPHTTALKNEFFATAFAPPPAHTSPSPPLTLTRTTSPFRMFTRAAPPSEVTPSRSLFQRGHRHARSVPDVNAGAGQSFASLGSSLRGGDVLDAPAMRVPESPSVLWAANADDEPLLRAQSLSPPPEAHRRTPSPPSAQGAHIRSVSPPLAAARRLGIEPSSAVSLQPFASTGKKQGFRSMRSFKGAKKV